MSGFSLPSTYHMDKGYLYFRSYDNRLILGGGRHIAKEAETTLDMTQPNKQIINYLIDQTKDISVLPNDIQFEYVWTGLLGVGESKRPIIEKVGEDCIAAVRMGGMGVAISSMIGKKVSKMLVDSFE